VETALTVDVGTTVEVDTAEEKSASCTDDVSAGTTSRSFSLQFDPKEPHRWVTTTALQSLPNAPQPTEKFVNIYLKSEYKGAYRREQVLHVFP
jgi:hypothetical protein